MLFVICHFAHLLKALWDALPETVPTEQRGAQLVFSLTWSKMHELHSWPCQDTLGGKYEWNLWDSSVVGSLSCRLVSCFCNRQLMMGELCLSDQYPTVELILHNPQRLQSDVGCYSSPPTASILSLSFFVSVFIDLKPSSSFLDWFSLHHLWLKKKKKVK